MLTLRALCIPSCKRDAREGVADAGGNAFQPNPKYNRTGVDAGRFLVASQT
jgi:hypothetical protein